MAVFDKTVPSGVPESTTTLRVKSADPGGKVAKEQVTVPPAPTDGVVQIHPPGAVSDWNVVPLGRGSCNDTFAASSGPSLETVSVYVSTPPATTGLGFPNLMIETSALCASVDDVSAMNRMK